MNSAMECESRNLNSLAKLINTQSKFFGQKKARLKRAFFDKTRKTYNLAKILATVSPIAAGVGAIVTPKSKSISTFSAADSPEAEIIAPA